MKNTVTIRSAAGPRKLAINAVPTAPAMIAERAASMCVLGEVIMDGSREVAPTMLIALFQSQ
ncbi:hypothetical protein [Tritonibacter mobilis]|uniref:hypothetical protein n=1 Tax=Tritonibacter mobilis TaxID=379347 RepID=UPI001D0D6E1A|nr:hypothetical protein [Tritonibacter mobilis]